MMSPNEAWKAAKRILQRIGEFHSREGAIARLGLMEITGKHPWGPRYDEDAHRYLGQNLRLTAEARLDRFRARLCDYAIHVPADVKYGAVPYKTENNKLNLGKSVEMCLGEVIRETLLGYDHADGKKEV